MNLSKETKNTLYSKFLLAQEEAVQMRQAAESALAIANTFAANLNTIDVAISSSPIKGGIIRKVFFLLSNAKEIFNLLETILSTIVLWREQIKKLQEQHSTPTSEESLTPSDTTKEDDTTV